MMKRFFVSIWVALLFVSIFLSSCDHKDQKIDNSLLWKISGNGLEKPSYLLGINNLLNTNLLVDIEGWEESFNETDQFVGEFIVLPDQEKGVQDTIRKLGQLILGEGYQKRLSEADYRKLDDGLRQVFNMSVNDIKDLDPNLIFMSYVGLLSYRVDSTYNLICEESMDSYLQTLAKEKQKSSLGLENVDERIALLFESDSFENKVNVLINSLENVDENVKNMKDFSSFYKEQSLSKIYDLYTREKNSSNITFFQAQFALDRKRNTDWLTKLPGIMKEQSSFIAVGALHLAGEDGLLSQLEKMGYKVEPVREKK